MRILLAILISVAATCGASAGAVAPANSEACFAMLQQLETKAVDGSVPASVGEGLQLVVVEYKNFCLEGKFKEAAAHFDKLMRSLDDDIAKRKK